jgi:hypothetical protein
VRCLYELIIHDFAVFRSFDEAKLAQMRFLQDTIFGEESSMSFSMPGSRMHLVQPITKSLSATTAQEGSPSSATATITAVSQHQNDEEDVPVGSTIATTGSDEASPVPAESSTNRTIVIAVMATFAVLAAALTLLALYLKKKAKRVSSIGEKTKSDGSKASGDDVGTQEPQETYLYE